MSVLSRRILVVALVVVLVAMAGATAFVLQGGLGKATSTLPPGCVRPPGGFLIVADVNGYNDSVGRNFTQNPWPSISVQKGSMVKITVCNADHQAHGFQVSHYYDAPIQTLAPGQVLNVSFIANQSGSFSIYCSIFCTIHSPWMQNGRLTVR